MGHRTLFLYTSLIGVLLLSGCDNKSESNLFRAQQCINTATADSVDSCLNFIGNQTSKRAYVLRCSAAFISQGIDELAIVKAISNINGEEGGNPTAPAIAALAMESPAVSSAAVEVCTQSGSSSLAALANFANISTAMSTILNFPPNPTAEDIQDLLDTYDPSSATAEDKQALGAAVIASQDNLCNPKTGLFKGTEACKDIDDAIASSSDPALVADALLANLKD
jgi:hypothetical protein